MRAFSALVAIIVLLLFPQQSRAAEAKVTVHLLDHTHKKETKTRFWIDWADVWIGVVESKIVAGVEADNLVHLLRKSLLSTESLNLCGHNPVYGIEASTGDGKVLKTSLCFTCVTWVQPGRRLEISGTPGAENDLCVALRKVIELPVELRQKRSK
jgi:hypothetical protein